MAIESSGKAKYGGHVGGNAVDGLVEEFQDEGLFHRRVPADTHPVPISRGDMLILWGADVVGMK